MKIRRMIPVLLSGGGAVDPCSGIYILDTFTAPDGNAANHEPDCSHNDATLTVVSGTWAISSGKLIRTSSGNQEYCVYDVGAADVNIEVTITPSASPVAGVILRDDGTDYWLLSVASKVVLYEFDGTTYTQRLEMIVPPTESFSLVAQCYADSFRFFVDEEYIGGYSGATRNQTATRFGFRSHGADASTFDNASITPSDSFEEVMPALYSPRPQILLDTDYDSDIDDVVDLALLLKLEAAGECDIAGICVSSANAKAAPALLAQLNYYGRVSIPVGANTSAGGGASTSTYVETIASTYGVTGYDDASDFDTGLTVYRETLAAAADNSITIVTSGGLTTLADLLKSPADGISAFTGAQLFASKVRCVVICGGYWPSGSPISDMAATATDAAYIFSHSAGIPLVLAGIELGASVATGGGGTITSLNASNPTRAAWLLYFGDDSPTNSRPAWAQLAILAAVRGKAGQFYESLVGTANVDTSTGATSWTTTDSNHAYLRKTLSDAGFVTAINTLVGAEPA